MAEDSNTNRTAIITGFGELFLAGVGDSLHARYRVVMIAADVVDISDLETGTVFQLHLQ